MTETNEPAWVERAGERGTVWLEARLGKYELWAQGDERAGVWRYGFVRPAGAPGGRASGSTLVYADDPASVRDLVLDAARRDHEAG